MGNPGLQAIGSLIWATRRRQEILVCRLLETSIKQVQASLGKSVAMGNPGLQVIGSSIQANLSKSAATGNPGLHVIGSLI